MESRSGLSKGSLGRQLRTLAVLVCLLVAAGAAVAAPSPSGDVARSPQHGGAKPGAVRSLVNLKALGELEAFERTRYPLWLRKQAGQMARNNFATNLPGLQALAQREILAYSYVVYHDTGWHRLRQNLALLQRYSGVVKAACEHYGVPEPLAMSIFAWENGGRTDQTSWAACTGFGQLSQGAVDRAHSQELRMPGHQPRVRPLMELLDGFAQVSEGAGGSWSHAWAHLGGQLQKALGERTLAQRHRILAQFHQVGDERLVPEANIEDSVLFMRFLLDSLAGRVDLALASYHNGLGNTDDLVRAYLRRHVPGAPVARGSLLSLRDLLLRYPVSYMQLWADPHCRQMLNGTRTMDGDLTTAANRREAMGDEADIYVFKTSGALAAYRADPRELESMLVQCRGRQEDFELEGFRSSLPRVRLHRLVAVHPAVDCYLRSVRMRYHQLKGHDPKLLWQPACAARAHRLGMAFDLKRVDACLEGILKEDWLLDRIYRERTPAHGFHICLNPRFGSEALRRFPKPLPPPMRSPRISSSSPLAKPKPARPKPKSSAQAKLAPGKRAGPED